MAGMNTTYRPISKRRLAELKGYVAWSTVVFRAALFAAAIGGFAWLARSVHLRVGQPLGDSALVWLVPALVAAVALYLVAGRWTGGRALRAALRKDIAGGVAAVHHVVAIDAVEVEEGEDEGPSFFILADDGKAYLFAGQYLAPYKRKGFPWKAFEILEAPQSKMFFGLVSRGEKLAPSASRAPFTWDEYKAFASFKGGYAVVDVDFDALKEGRLVRRAARAD
jgi:hypothetical protein